MAQLKQLKQNTFRSIVTHELLFPPVFTCLFVCQQVIKRYLKISRNRTVTCARQKSCKEEYNLETERKETENILLQQNE